VFDLHSLTMIDLNDLRARPDAYQDAARKKRITVDVPAFLAIDAQRRELLPRVESMRARRNTVSKTVPSMAGEEKQRAIAEMKELAGELEQREDELAAPRRGDPRLPVHARVAVCDPVGRGDQAGG
jgi:seryl-tRNA synthetase